jgi:UDP-glucuronate decarboxylase
MRILVAGAAGFLGTNLCRSLLNQDYEVIGVDNLYTGSFRNLATLDNFRNFSFIHHDVNHKLNAKFDAVVNLASPASPIQYQRDPIYTLKTNILGTANLLDLALENDAIYLQASTSEVYGDPEESPQKESYWGKVNPVGIRSCYDEGKRAAETLITDFKRQYALDARIARIFNTYGPHMAVDDGRVVSNFINQALRNRAITIYGDGMQVRSFCFVDDLTAGLESLLFANNISGPVNLGNPEPITMNQLAKEVIEKTSSSSEVIFQEIPQDDPKTRTPDISLATNLLNWKPMVSREVGLQQTINYFAEDI